MRRLITIPFSHYCEKARWALDHFGVPYVEEGHCPVFHIGAIKRAGGSRTSPALIEDDGTVLDDSTTILEHLDRRAAEDGTDPDRRLFPDDVAEEVRRLEELFDAKVGPATRRIGYYHLLKFPRVVKRLMLAEIPARERLAVRTLNPLIRAAIRRALHIDPAGVERSTERLTGVFDEIDARLADGRRFLVGGRFTAADLTFAALAAPLLFPDESPAPMPPLAEMPDAIREVVEPWRARPAGRFALALYAEQRPASRRAAA